VRRCHGTNREHGSGTSKRARDVRTGESRDSSNLLLLLVLFKKLIKLRCINRIKDINKNAKRTFFSPFFKEVFFILFSRS